MRNIGQSMLSGIRRLVVSDKFYLILILLFVFCFYMYIPLNQFARFYHIPVTPWLLPSFLGHLNMQIVYGGICMILFEDVFLVDGFSQSIIIRSGRKQYICGQILYIFLASFLLVLYIVIISLLMVLPNLRFESDWGTLLRTMASNGAKMSSDTGIEIPLILDPSLMAALDAQKATLIAFLCQWFVTALMGLIIGFGRVCISPSCGLGLAGAMIVLDIFPQGSMRFALGKAVFYVDIFAWANPSMLDWANVGVMPPPLYGISVILILLVVFSICSAEAFCRRDL